jgi:acetyl-CoA C-acetyltransferase
MLESDHSRPSSPGRGMIHAAREETKKMNPSHLPAERTPVIVGIGEITDRPSEIAVGLEPLALLVEALKRAEADSGTKLLHEIDSLDVVNFLSWRYREPEKLLSSRLGRRRKPDPLFA